MSALQARRTGGSDAGRWWALIAISASVLVVGLDLTVLNLALPVLSAGLHALPPSCNGSRVVHPGLPRP